MALSVFSNRWVWMRECSSHCPPSPVKLWPFIYGQPSHAAVTASSAPGVVRSLRGGLCAPQMLPLCPFPGVHFSIFFSVSPFLLEKINLTLFLSCLIEKGFSLLTCSGFSSFFLEIEAAVHRMILSWGSDSRAASVLGCDYLLSFSSTSLSWVRPMVRTYMHVPSCGPGAGRCMLSPSHLEPGRQREK